MGTIEYWRDKLSTDIALSNGASLSRADAAELLEILEACSTAEWGGYREPDDCPFCGRKPVLDDDEKRWSCHGWSSFGGAHEIIGPDDDKHGDKWNTMIRTAFHKVVI